MAKFLSGIKKLAVMLIAGLMLLGVVPIGMISKPETVNAEGEFMRLSPTEEAFVSAVPGEIDKRGRELFKGVNLAGSQNDTYMGFDLSSLAEVPARDIRSAVLRLAVVYTGAESSDTVELKLMQNSDWNDGMTYFSRPSDTNEEKLADIYVGGSRKTGSVIEVDLTDRVKELIKKKNYRIDLHADAEQNGLAAVFAASDYEDKAFRPCLKVVTGDARDTDSADLTKAWLEGVNAEYDDGKIRISDEKSAYLRFRFNRDNIQGAMYDIRLRAYTEAADDGGKISVSVVDCGERELSDMTDELNSTFVGSVDADSGAWGITLTDAVNDIYNGGGETVTVKVSASGGSVWLCAEGDGAPEFDIRATDSSKVVAVTEAGSAAIGENAGFGNITGNLSESYSAADGTKAFFKWSAFEPETGERVNGVLSGDGRITRPQWYEDSRTIKAKAIISSGAYRIERSYILTVMPSDKPDFSVMNVSDYTDIGSSESEKASGAEFADADAHSSWMDGSFLTYRTLQNGGFVIVNQLVDPDGLNYVTFKLRSTELPTVGLIMENVDADAESVTVGADKISAEDGFVYVTYPLPREWTSGRGVVSLKLSAEEMENDDIPWSIYGVYTGTDAYFEPLSYTSQGEVFVNKKPVEDTAFYGFITQLYNTTKQIMPIFGGADSDRTESDSSGFGWVDSNGESVLAFANGSESIAVSLAADGTSAKVRRSSAYYDSAAEMPVEENNGIIDIKYGNYRIIRNSSAEEIRFSDGFSGIYKNLVNGRFYSFIADGELADDSVLPPNTELQNGEDISLLPGETAIMELEAKPLKCADWRVGKINGKPIADISIDREESINEISVKNIGAAADGGKMKVVCCVYERGMLSGMSSQYFETRHDCDEYTVAVNPISLKGRTLKVYVEPTDSMNGGLRPKLELP